MIFTDKNFKPDTRFDGLIPSTNKVWLSSPTVHGEEQHWVYEAIRTNWLTTLGANVNAVEDEFKAMLGRKEAVAMSSATAALHLAVRLAAEKLYGSAPVNKPLLSGKKVFCSDMTFDATVNPVAYEGGEAVFIDTEPDSWNMSPEALDKAFDKYPDVKIVVLAHLYGTPSKLDEIINLSKQHGALIIEDAAESLGATYNGIQTGTFGDYSVISFNGNKIITGSSGGMLLTDDIDGAKKIRKWSTQARDDAAWYQHTELGYNYRMSNIIAGVVRGQIPYLESHIAQKRAIYEYYRDGLSDLPVAMNPIPDNTKANYWLSCLTIDKGAMCYQKRDDHIAEFETATGKTCPSEILSALSSFNCEGRPIWKPMHMQPIYKNMDFISTSQGNDVGADIFERGLCLPSDNKMTRESQDLVIEIIHRCFK